MLITCPNCRTRYTLQPAQLGQGRNVNCSNCAHVWFADPKDAQPDPPPPPPMAAPQPPQQPYPPQGYPQQGYPPQGYAPPPQGYAPPGYPAPPPPQAQPAPPPPPVPAPPPPEPAAPPPDIPEPDPEPVPEPELDDDIAGLTTDIDSMFEDEDEDIEPFQSLIGDDDDDDGLTDIESPDEMEDPDYISEVFSADEQEPDDEAPRKSPILKIIGYVFALLIIFTIAAAFFLKDEVVKHVPALESVYEMIGFYEVGEGLQIQKVEFAQESDAGLEVLVVRGRIENVSDKIRPVPMLRATLFDGENEEIHHQDVAPFKSQIKASEKLSFKIRIKEPSPLRRRVSVTFVDPKEAPKN